MCSETNFDDNNSINYDSLSRREIRALIFHLLYATEAFDYQESLQAIVDNFNRGFDLDIPHDSEVVKVTQSIIDAREKLDTLYKPLLANWRLERVSMVVKLILRFGIWELNNTDIDKSIIINEAIELTKCFAEKDAYRFVNGILDRIAKNQSEKKVV